MEKKSNSEKETQGIKGGRENTLKEALKSSFSSCSEKETGAVPALVARAGLPQLSPGPARSRGGPASTHGHPAGGRPQPLRSPLTLGTAIPRPRRCPRAVPCHAVPRRAALCEAAAPVPASPRPAAQPSPPGDNHL